MSADALVVGELPLETIHRIHAEAEAVGLKAETLEDADVKTMVLTYSGGMVGAITSVKTAGDELLVQGLYEFPAGEGQSFAVIDWKPVAQAMKLIRANHLVARSMRDWT